MSDHTCEDKNLLVSGKENNIGEKRVERAWKRNLCEEIPGETECKMAKGACK